jgi:hypothetical protein
MTYRLQRWEAAERGVTEVRGAAWVTALLHRHQRHLWYHHQASQHQDAGSNDKPPQATISHISEVEFRFVRLSMVFPVEQLTHRIAATPLGCLKRLLGKLRERRADIQSSRR